MSDSTQKMKLSEKEIHEIPLDDLVPDKNQVRKEFKLDELEALIESIKSDGLIQPILITINKDGKNRIVDGERRWRAHKEIVRQGMDDADVVTRYSTIRAIYIEKDSQLLGIIGNLARDTYNPMEMADAYERVKELLKSAGQKISDEEISKRVGKARNTVVEYNSLLKLPKKIQEKARKDSCVPVSILRVLARSSEPEAEKIAKYEELHKKYSTSPEDNKAVPQTMPNRKANAVRKKIDAVNDALRKIDFDNVDASEKESFIESLEAAIETSRNLLDKLLPLPSVATPINDDEE